jgi:ArsR family transcriptional regulator, arsenate/arsenite/antimonite-responsive transcriptional repressor
MDESEELAKFAKAMGHPTRIAILKFLASLDHCYFGEIHQELPIAKATVSQHLKELKDAGLIVGKIETPKVKYCICHSEWEKAQIAFNTFFQKSIKSPKCCD